MTTTNPQLTSTLTPSQRKTFDLLLAVGGDRPTPPPGIAEKLTNLITTGTEAALASWNDRSLWMGKTQVTQILRCEGQTLADLTAPPRAMALHPTTAIGIVSHRAIQIAHTHPGKAVNAYVQAAIEGALNEEKFNEYWLDASESTQSDLISQSTSKVTAFLDSWPPLAPSWTPRFEESIHARLKKLTLGGRIDLVLGRPRNTAQTMVLCDLKSVGISEHHAIEADFYALISTLRHGIPPFRSFIFSLASGEYTPPDVTSTRLLSTAELVAEAVNRHVAIALEQRPPELTPGPHCRWCPLKDTCPVSSTRAAPEPTTSQPEEY